MNKSNMKFKYIFVGGEAQKTAVFLLEKTLKLLDINYNLTVNASDGQNSLSVFDLGTKGSEDNSILLFTSELTEDIKLTVPENIKKIVVFYNENKDVLKSLFCGANFIEYGINEPRADFTALNVRKLDDNILCFELLMNDGISRIKLPYKKDMVSAALGVSGVLSALGKKGTEIVKVMNLVK